MSCGLSGLRRRPEVIEVLLSEKRNAVAIGLFHLGLRQRRMRIAVARTGITSLSRSLLRMSADRAMSLLSFAFASGGPTVHSMARMTEEAGS